MSRSDVQQNEQGSQDSNNCFSTLCLFLRCCFSLSPGVNPEICSLNRIRTSTLSATPQEQRANAQGSVHRQRDTHHICLHSPCVTHITEPSLPQSHAVNALNFQYDDMWHFTHQFFMYSLFAFTEGLDFHSYSCRPDKPVHVVCM